MAPLSSLPSDPAYVYHATNEDNAREIAASGWLVPHRPWYGTDQRMWPDGATEKRSYFSANAGIVWQFAPAEGRPVVLRVLRSSAPFRRESTGDVYVTKKIAAGLVEILTDQGWQPLVELRLPNPILTLAGIAALFAMFPITPVVAGATALHNHIKNGRKKNPLDPEAFAPHLEREAEGRHKADWTPHKMEEAMHAAEGRFVVKLAGPLYGCGTNGCAAPLEDGRVLKVTIDEAEARWARLTHRRGVPGMVQVDVPPTVVGLDDWYQGEGPEPGDDEPPIDPFKMWAYVREAADDIPEALWRELGNSPRPDPEQQIYEGIEVFRRLGYELEDWQGRFNIGLDRDGNIVVRDGRLVR